MLAQDHESGLNADDRIRVLTGPERASAMATIELPERRHHAGHPHDCFPFATVPS
jgi:hypothetical protein